MVYTTHRQSALPHIGCYEAINSSILCISGCKPLHLVLVNASEHQDSNGREDNEDDDGRQNDNSQCGHTVAGKLFSCEGTETFTMYDFPYQGTILCIFRTQNKAF